MVGLLPPCPVCSNPVVYGGVGRPPIYCSRTCKSRAGTARDPQRALRYLAKHPEKARANLARWRGRHKDIVKQNNAAWYEQNRERVYQNNLRWRQHNPERAAAQSKVTYNRRRARLAGADGPGVSVADWQRLVRRCGGRCVYCGKATTALQMDHVIPLARGGRHRIGNVLPACARCNRDKGARFLLEWRYCRTARAPHRGVRPDIL